MLVVVTIAETVDRGSAAPAPMARESTEAADVTRLFRTHARTTRRFLLRMGVPPNQADDVLQQVFVVVWNKLKTFRSDASERAWVLSIARRVAANHRRKRHQPPNPPTVRNPATPEEQASRREAAQLVRDFLQTLDERQRIVFHLSDIEGLTAPEIAHVTDANLNTVYTRLRAARRAFRRFVDQVWEGTEPT